MAFTNITKTVFSFLLFSWILELGHMWPWESRACYAVTAFTCLIYWTFLLLFFMILQTRYHAMSCKSGFLHKEHGNVTIDKKKVSEGSGILFISEVKYNTSPDVVESLNCRWWAMNYEVCMFAQVYCLASGDAYLIQALINEEMTWSIEIYTNGRARENKK